MSSQKTVLFYDMFPFARDCTRLATDYSSARVASASVNQAKTAMDITLVLTDPIPPFEISIIEDIISKEFGIKIVTVNATYALFEKKAPEDKGTGTLSSSPRKTQDKEAVPLSSGHLQNPKGEFPDQKTRPLMGRAVKTAPTPIGEITVEHGKVAVKGEVCAVRSKYIEKSKSWILNFDITDYTGTLNIYKFIHNEDASKLINSIKTGMKLIVTGRLLTSKFDNELNMEPRNIFPFRKERRADNADAKRVELHLHTKMSAMDALTDTKDVIKRAAEWGHPAIAITDHGVVHSFPTAAHTAHGLKNKIKVIYGVEAYLRDSDTTKTKKKRRNNHVVLLVKNQAGLNNLYKLITKSHIENFDGRPIIYKNMLQQHRDGLLVGSACEAGEVYKAIINNVDTVELHEIASLYDYLEIMPVCNNSFMIYSENPRVKEEEELREYNRQIVDLGKALNKPVVATGDVHFLDPEQEIYRQIILTSKGYSDSTGEMPLFFRTTDEMLEEFKYLGEETAFEVVVKNPQLIADMCEIVNPLPPPNQLFSPKLDGSAEELRRIVEAEALKLYGENPPKIVPERVEYELHDILRLNYDVIYMAAQKLVAYLKEQKSRVGSRGSVGSSFVAYLAGITEVNPLPAHYRCPACKFTEFPGTEWQDCRGDGSPDKLPPACGADMPDKACPNCGAALVKDGFNIPFETFMGFDGAKVPDIDLNISSEHQALAHKYTVDMFGSEYVYRAGTINTIKEKNAYGFVKKYLEATGKRVSKAEENRLALGCVGVKQTTGQHPGGLIVIPQNTEVTDFSPAHYPSDDKEKGIITLHFEYEFIEDNLIKLDILGQKNPTMLRMLEDMTGIDADDISLDDPETMAIFSSPVPLGLPDDDKIIGNTGSIGIPEFGTPFTREMLNDTQPDSFDTLIRLSGYSHGTGVWLGNARDLLFSGKAKVSETISSREDIILFLESKGIDKRYAYNISESIRKGKGLPDGAEDEMKRLNVPGWYIESCKKVTYLFPKAHAVAYVMMAFRIAWFKVHRPLEFYSTHFYRRRKNFDLELMTRGIERVKSKIRELMNNPDQKTGTEEGLLTTLESCYEFYKRGFDFAPLDLYESDAEHFLIVDDKMLRPPFITVNRLGDAAAFSLVENRKNRTFISIDDIAAACPGVTKTTLDKLKILGALGDLPDSSQMSLF